MGHRKRENENWDFDDRRRCGRHSRGCGFPLFGLVFGIVSFALTLAFKVVALVFEVLSQSLPGSSSASGGQKNKPAEDRTAGNPSPSYTIKDMDNKAASAARKDSAACCNKDNVKEFKRTPEQKAEPKKQQVKEKNTVNEDHGKDIYVIIFILTVIPAVLTLAMGKPIYAGAIALTGFILLLITGMIKGLADKTRKKAAAEFKEFEEASKDNDETEKLIKDAFEKLFEIRKDIARVEDAEVRTKMEAICSTGEKIIGEVRTNPESLSQVRKFFYYYLDAFAEIVKKYQRLSGFEESSEEVEKLMAETEKSFNDIDGIFKELCEKLLEKDMMHLKAELNVIKNSN